MAVFLTLIAVHAQAAQFDLVAPAGSVQFGAQIAQLPNGNIVVTDPGRAEGGAVYLFGPSGNLISTLTGETGADRSTMSIQVLTNGNYVVVNPGWSDGTNYGLGAVTWGDANKGVSGRVSIENSLIGAAKNDQIGRGGVVPLKNGNYVVQSVNFSYNGIDRAGAITWGDGRVGTHGVVSPGNSVVGVSALESVGTPPVVALPNGNYVFRDLLWNNNAGAAIWFDGTRPTSGTTDTGVAVRGTSPGDTIGNYNIVVLKNSNYVVLSPNWNQDRGAATWVNGAIGLAANVSEANSLVGTLPGQAVGYPIATALDDGNVVVCSSNWGDAEIPYAGAITWMDGNRGLAGSVSPQNSLLGRHALDFLGTGTGFRGFYQAVTPLPDGDYILKCPYCDNGTILDAGVVTVVKGGAAATGYFDPSDALVGDIENDYVGSGPITVLANGSYVVASQQWQSSPGVIVGAATWVSRNSTGKQAVSTGNSLYGSVVSNPFGGPIAEGILALKNGNYVVSSPQWQKDGLQGTGAVTWGNGNTGVTGVISAQNSLLGSHELDLVGSGGVYALPSGNYIVDSPMWNNGATQAVGAITWADGTQPTSGSISTANSLTGKLSLDEVGDGYVAVFADGRYVVNSTSWDNGEIFDAGAVSVLDDAPTSGGITSSNSVLGTFAAAGTGNWGGVGLEFTYDPSRSRLVVGRYATNQVTVLTPDSSANLFTDGFEDDAPCAIVSVECHSQQ